VLITGVSHGQIKQISIGDMAEPFGDFCGNG
jgi:hypothetical protein